MLGLGYKLGHVLWHVQTLSLALGMDHCLSQGTTQQAVILVSTGKNELGAPSGVFVMSICSYVQLRLPIRVVQRQLCRMESRPHLIYVPP